ncbi:MAG TPA: PEP-CTERM sorting domain-containing protein [Tepidisphaeraceae bacterium]
MSEQSSGVGTRGRRVIAALSLAAVATAAHAATLNSPLQLGDTFISDNGMANLSQIRAGARVGGQIAYGANERIPGLAIDATGNLYLAGNPGGTGLTVEQIQLGQATSTVLLDSTSLTGGTTLRDLAVAPDGTIYTLYSSNGAIDKFTPAGGGTYTRTALGTLTGFTGADRGSGHQLSLSGDGNYLITSSRTQNRLWSMNTGTGANQTWTTPTGNGPVSGTQLTLSAESVLDPRGNKILVPMGNDGLYEVDFDPATGTFPTAAPFRLTNDTVAAFVDALTFDQADNLLVSTRDTSTIGSLRPFTEAELLAAESGSPFTLLSRTPTYTAADARIARDVIVSGVVPEPATTALLAIGAVGLLARRRRA